MEQQWRTPTDGLSLLAARVAPSPATSRRRIKASLTVQKSRLEIAGHGRQAGSERTKLAELAVGDEQGAQGAKALESFVAVLLGSVLVDGQGGGSRIASAEVLALPDEVLEQVALVLGEQEDFGLLDGIAHVRNEVLALGGELGGGRLQRLRGEEAVQGNVDLLVGGRLAIGERCRGC